MSTLCVHDFNNLKVFHVYTIVYILLVCFISSETEETITIFDMINF